MFLEFSEIYSKIRQGLNDQDYTLLQEGMKGLLGLPPPEQILAQDLIEILKCLEEVIKDLYPASQERMSAFAERMNEFFEEADEQDSDDRESEAENAKEEGEFYDIRMDVRILTEKFFAGFTKFTPNVQDAFIKFLKYAAPLTSEIYQSNFRAFLDYFETQPAKRLEIFPRFLDYGGNLLPGEIIRLVSERFFTVAKDPIRKKILFASYLGSFLLQFYDIYPDSITDKITQLISLIKNTEYYFRSFAVDVLKTLIQTRPEVLASHFLEMLNLLSAIDPKIQSSFVLSIRDLLNSKNSSILENLAGREGKSEEFVTLVTHLMLKSNFEVGDFVCEILFDFLHNLVQDHQIRSIMRLLNSWKTLTEVPTYHIMLLQNFVKKTKLIKIKFVGPEELEHPANLKALLHEIEVAVENKLAATSKEKQPYDRFN